MSRAVSKLTNNCSLMCYKTRRRLANAVRYGMYHKRNAVCQVVPQHYDITMSALKTSVQTQICTILQNQFN